MNKPQWLESLKIPAFKDWNVFAGGTFAARDKNAYGFTTKGLSEKSANIQWSVQPVSSEQGRHRGYSLSVFGLPGKSGHAWVSPSRQVTNIPGLLFSDPRSAVAAARHVHETVIAKTICENLGVPPKEFKKIVDGYDESPKNKPSEIGPTI